MPVASPGPGNDRGSCRRGVSPPVPYPAKGFVKSKPPGGGCKREGARPRAEDSQMAAQIAPDHPIRELFSGVVERSFQRHLGVHEPQVTRYLAIVMVDFTHRASIFRTRDARVQRLEEVAEML